MDNTRELTIVIERAENNFSAYIREVDGIAATGNSIDELKTEMAEIIEEYCETCKGFGIEIPEEFTGEYTLRFELDVKSFLSIYEGIFTKSGLERLTGINQKQLWHYANGTSTPRPAQKQKIENALHRLGNELISLHL